MEGNDIHSSDIQDEDAAKEVSRLFPSFFPWTMDDSDGNANESASFQESIRIGFTDNTTFPCTDSEQEMTGFFDSFSIEACPTQESVNLQGSFGYLDESNETHRLKEQNYYSKPSEAELVDDRDQRILSRVREYPNSAAVKHHAKQLKEQRAQRATQILAELEDTFTKVTRILEAFSMEELFDEAQFSLETPIQSHHDIISSLYPQQIPGIRDLSPKKQIPALQNKIKSLQIEVIEKETTINQREVEVRQAKQTMRALQKDIKTIKTQQVVKEASQTKQPQTLRTQIQTLQTLLATKETALNERSSEASLKEIHLSQLQFLLSIKHRDLEAKETNLQKQAEELTKRVDEYQTARDLETSQQKTEKEEQREKPFDFFIGRESIFHQRIAEVKRYVEGHWRKPVKMVEWESGREREKRLGKERSGRKRAASSSAVDDSGKVKRMRIGRPTRIPTRKSSLGTTTTRSEELESVITNKTSRSQLATENEMQRAYDARKEPMQPATEDEGDSETLRGDETDKE